MAFYNHKESLKIRVMILLHPPETQESLKLKFGFFDLIVHSKLEERTQLFVKSFVNHKRFDLVNYHDYHLTFAGHFIQGCSV